MESSATQHRPTLGGSYTPGHDAPPPQQSQQSQDAWRHLGTIVAIAIALLSSVVTYAVAQARLEEQLKTKVDATAFEELRGDVRVMRTAICAETPQYCRQSQ